MDGSIREVLSSPHTQVPTLGYVVYYHSMLAAAFDLLCLHTYCRLVYNPTSACISPRLRAKSFPTRGCQFYRAVVGIDRQTARLLVRLSNTSHCSGSERGPHGSHRIVGLCRLSVCGARQSGGSKTPGGQASPLGLYARVQTSPGFLPRPRGHTRQYQARSPTMVVGPGRRPTWLRGLLPLSTAPSPFAPLAVVGVGSSPCQRRDLKARGAAEEATCRPKCVFATHPTSMWPSHQRLGLGLGQV